MQEGKRCYGTNECAEPLVCAGRVATNGNECVKPIAAGEPCPAKEYDSCERGYYCAREDAIPLGNLGNDYKCELLHRNSLYESTASYLTFSALALCLLKVMAL